MQNFRHCSLVLTVFKKGIQEGRLKLSWELERKLSRSPSTHCMSPWMKKLFIELMPRILCMRRPDFYYRRKSLGFYSLKESSQPTNESNLAMNFSSKETFSCDNSMKRGEISSIPTYDSRLTEECISFRPDEDLPPEIRNALRGVMYIANHMRNADKDLEGCCIEHRLLYMDFQCRLSSNGRQCEALLDDSHPGKDTNSSLKL
ncbi:hypothetical protein QYM36_016922 [Artemia franciscana]|uniref:Neurotransmitter-gated ion-channel transmembrane domain-containing protein n=1 Tax=Artemia franciscana TaxID=6661 RepID=A0AA88HFW6_ARTSF|nr:hypothetical protein QYM36_016922 [Artemia franciscana]